MIILLIVKGQNKDVVVIFIIPDPNAKDPILLLLDNSDSPSIVEQ